ncbi:hypothetical protein QV65_04450 [Rhodococcus erythropolis]|nr:hypothetical protein QV65_04450 [Rhodococcus erythropolis]
MARLAFAAIATALVVGLRVTGKKIFGALALVGGIVMYLTTLLAMKGTYSWSYVIDNFSNTRLGYVAYAGGIVAMIVLGVRSLRRSSSIGN